MSQELAITDQREKIIDVWARDYNVDPPFLVHALKTTIFKPDKKGREITNEQLFMLVNICRDYGLSPLTRELHAFPDGDGITPVLGIDGWCTMINRNPLNNGVSFRFSETMVEGKYHKPCPEWCECIIHIKGRDYPVVVTEFFDEVYRDVYIDPRQPDKKPFLGPWQTHTKRMLRHKTLIQAARVAFGYSGLYDERDEGRTKPQPPPIEINPIMEQLADLRARVDAARDIPALEYSEQTEETQGDGEQISGNA